MKARTKIAILLTSAVLGGYGVAYAAGYSNPILTTFNSTPDTTQPATTANTPAATSTPTDSVATSNVNESTPSVDVTPANVNVTPAAKPTPAPKPATVYSTTHSADTPCRLYDQAIYTNDCGTPAPTQQTASAPTTDSTPTDAPATDPVPNPTVSNDNPQGN